MIKELDIIGVTEMGSVVYTSIKVSLSWTMTEVLKEVKAKGYEMFMLLDGSMKHIVRV